MLKMRARDAVIDKLHRSIAEVPRTIAETIFFRRCPFRPYAG